MTNKKVALLFSGGPDSTTLLFDLIDQGREVVALTFDFGEAEGYKELIAAKSIIERVGVEHHFFDFSGPLKEFYGLNQPQFMRGAQWTTMQTPPVNESEDIQPFGSSIALLLAASWAVKNGIEDVFYAVHAEDARFTDNKLDYFSLLSDVTSKCEGEQFRIKFHTPYISIRKHEVFEKGASLEVPFNETWSCGKGLEAHCGTCPTCHERAGAFAVNGIQDPTLYINEFAQVLEPNSL